MWARARTWSRAKSTARKSVAHCLRIAISDHAIAFPAARMRECHECTGRYPTAVRALAEFDVGASAQLEPSQVHS